MRQVRIVLWIHLPGRLLALCRRTFRVFRVFTSHLRLRARPRKDERSRLARDERLQDCAQNGNVKIQLSSAEGLRSRILILLMKRSATTTSKAEKSPAEIHGGVL